MKKTTFNISFDEGKASALVLYLSQKGTTVETELEKAFDTLYTKTVPAGVRDFIDTRSGTAPAPAAPKPRKPKPPRTEYTEISEVSADERHRYHPVSECIPCAGIGRCARRSYCRNGGGQTGRGVRYALSGICFR